MEDAHPFHFHQQFYVARSPPFGTSSWFPTPASGSLWSCCSSCRIPSELATVDGVATTALLPRAGFVAEPVGSKRVERGSLARLRCWPCQRCLLPWQVVGKWERGATKGTSQREAAERGRGSTGTGNTRKTPYPTVEETRVSGGCGTKNTMWRESLIHSRLIPR